jgi:hypothetical protein
MIDIYRLAVVFNFDDLSELEGLSSELLEGPFDSGEDFDLFSTEKLILSPTKTRVKTTRPLEDLRPSKK